MFRKWGFFENIDEIRDISKFRQKGVFWKISTQSRFSQISSKIDIFRKFRAKSRFSQIWTKIDFFLHISTKTDIFANLTQTEILSNFDQN